MKRKGLMTPQTYCRRTMAKVVALSILLGAITFGLPSLLEAIIGIR